jgi:hypothetical protein
MKRPGFEADRFGIMMHDDATGAVRELAPPGTARPTSIAWSGRQDDLRSAEDVGQTKLFAIDVKTSKVTPLTGDGHVTASSVGPKDIVYAADNLKGPAQLFAIPAKGGKAGRPSS